MAAPREGEGVLAFLGWEWPRRGAGADGRAAEDSGPAESSEFSLWHGSAPAPVFVWR
jgi:hypothetical protein